MALVLNGSGSITGLSAGGLPDGSVTADDIASTLDLSGKTVTLPAGTGGKVLQVVQSLTPTGDVVTTSSTLTQIYTATFTPTSASSKVLVMLQGHTAIQNSASGGYAAGLFTIYRNGSLIYDPNTRYSNDQTYYHQTNVTSTDIWFLMHLSYLDSPATTSAITYALYAANKGGAAGNIRNRGHHWTFMEIAA
jgi:hypothetical protein